MSQYIASIKCKSLFFHIKILGQENFANIQCTLYYYGDTWNFHLLKSF